MIEQPHVEVATEAGAESVVDLLDAVEGLVVNGRRVPLTHSVVLDEDGALEYIDRARHALPDAIKQAHQLLERQLEIVAEAQAAARQLVEEAAAEAARIGERAGEQARQIVETAHAEADRTVEAAREHVETLVAEHVVTRQAEERATATLAEAQAAALGYREDADAYARQVLEGVDENLGRATATLHKALEALKSPPAGR